MSKREWIFLSIMFVLIGFIVYQQFIAKTEVVYDPMKNPTVIQAMQVDAIKQSKLQRQIDSMAIVNQIRETQLRSLQGFLMGSQEKINKSHRQLEDKKKSIEGMDDLQLEEDINGKLNN